MFYFIAAFVSFLAYELPNPPNWTQTEGIVVNAIILFCGVFYVAKGVSDE